jgi:hypothetical protein
MDIVLEIIARCSGNSAPAKLILCVYRPKEFTVVPQKVIRHHVFADLGLEGNPGGADDSRSLSSRQYAPLYAAADGVRDERSSRKFAFGF